MALSKRDIQYIRSLHHKKFRQKYNKFIVEGDKIAREALAQRPEWVDRVLALPDWLQAEGMSGQTVHFRCEAVTERELSQLSGLRTPNQVVLIMHTKEPTWRADVVRAGLSLYLDGLQDPGNVGTMLRIADWFGLPYVFASPTSADGYNPKVLQASMGAFLRVPYLRLPWEELIRPLADLPVLGASLEGSNVFEARLPARGLLVVGREGSGIRPETANHLTHRLYIPGRGGAESLNAAVATGIIVAQLLWGT